MIKRYRKPHCYKKRKPVYYSPILWSAFFSLILLGSIFYLLVLASVFQVKEARITGLPDELQADLKISVQALIDGNVLSFPTRSILLLNVGKIEREMLQKFPYLASIDVRRDFPDYLKVEAIKREGLATFCQAGDCFAIDGEGIIFEVGDSVKPRLNVLISADKVNLASRVIDPLELSQLMEIDRFIEREAGVAIKEIQLVTDEKLIIETQEGWEIYLNPKGEVEWELIKLRALLTEKLSLEEREGLEWVELRFGNFANPKYKD